MGYTQAQLATRARSSQLIARYESGSVSPASLQLPVEQRAAVFALVIGVLFAAQAAAAPSAGFLFDQYGATGLAALLTVPIIAAAATHLTLTRTLPNPDPST